MDSAMNNLISDQLHVAQQSRREKLRVQHCSPARSGQRVDDTSSGVEVIQPIFNSNLIQVCDDARNNANLMYNPAGTSSGMRIEFSTNAADERASVPANSINLASSNIDGSLSPRRESNLESCGVWKSVGHNLSADNWNTDCFGRYYSKRTYQDVVNDLSAVEMRAKVGIMEHPQNQSQYGEMNFGPQLNYHNALHNEFTTAVVGLQPNWIVRGNTCAAWGSYGGGSEPVGIVPYGYQPDGARILSCSGWNDGEISSQPQGRRDPMVVDSHSQGLSLSLCSHPAASMITGNQFGDSHISHSIPLHDVANNGFQDLKTCAPNYFVKTTIVEQGKSLQESVGPSTSYYRQIGPLGPFTGYATILKSSRFLKPAQQLLDEYCAVIGKFPSSNIGVASDRSVRDNGDLAAAVNSIVSDIGTTGDVLGVPTSMLQDSGEITRGGTKSSPGESRPPDYHLKKAKLLYMLEEVSRKYKQYYQQMQMVVSAFESVAGLATTTPYISCALKTVSRNFNHLKNAITDQLRHIKNLLGEDFSFPPSGIREGGDVSTKRSKYADHSFPRHKSGGSNVGLIEPQQHIWRPQRGLPERAVSVLRAWLFEHFLHPYPTDTDKHMLATQTGLTRSQVSNWFINARVRLWKPMVEEVHMLETKSLSERKSNAVEEDNVSTNNVDVHFRSDHAYNKMVGSSATNMNLDCSGMGALSELGEACIPKLQWSREKAQSRVHSHNASSIDEGMMNISHYHRQIGHEMGGIGPISLTLGLRQSADQLYRLDGNQHQHQQSPYLQQQQDHMRQVHLGGHSSTHEFPG